VVWYPVDLADRKAGSFKDILGAELFSTYAFKTKGRAHQMVKKKDADGKLAVASEVSFSPPQDQRQTQSSPLVH
jgi:hypothetical protein